MVAVLEVTDPSDPRLDDFRHLNSLDRRPDLPSGKGLVIAEGVLVVQRVLDSRFPLRALLGVARRLDELRTDPTFDDATADVPFFLVTAEVMAEVVGFHLNRGVLAAADRAAPLALADVLPGARTVVVLEGVNDHENLGSMFRNAAGLGVDAVLLGARCADPYYRRSVRVSMGHVLRVPTATVPDWPRGLDVLRAQGFRLVSLTPAADAVPLSQALGAERVALLVGAEGPGLTEQAMAATDVRARIPMAPGTDSLNVATAAALACYERVR
ncbi:TrmH family RNA methyltransferase [Rhodococcus aerolatus]